MTAQPTKAPRKVRPRAEIKTRETSIAVLKAAGMTEREIATTTNLPKTTIHQVLHRIFNKQEIESFRTEEPEILDEKRKLILNALDPDDIKKMSGRDKVVSYGILHDKRFGTQAQGESRPLVIINKISVGGQMPVDNVIEVVDNRPDNPHNIPDSGIVEG